MVVPKSTCAHWFLSLLCADQAWAEFNMERAWPVPMASPDQTDEYLREVSGGFTTWVVMKLPGGQTTVLHTSDPAELLAQEGHFVQEPTPADEKVPAAHATQVEAPVEEAYLPAAQRAHWDPPVTSLNLPAAQLTQELWPAADTVPAAHDKHIEEPVVV